MMMTKNAAERRPAALQARQRLVARGAAAIPLREVLRRAIAINEASLEGDELARSQQAIALLHQQLTAAQKRIEALLYRNACLQKGWQRTRRNAALAEERACADELTGLPNRRLLKDRIQQAMARADREQKSVALFVIDLDGFKAVNDSLGHAAGDALLVQVANRLKASTRASDTVCRYGGDEFVVLLPDAADQHAMAREMSKLQALSKAPFLVDGRAISVGFSIGAASYPADGRSYDALVHRADLMMYRTKLAARGR